jgi:group I intron endonuclease
MERIHYLYKITNIINEKVYIGQSVKPVKRWASHMFMARNPKRYQLVIHRAMTKYGIEYFKMEVIGCCNTQENTNFAEEELIKQYNSLAPNGYNILARAIGTGVPRIFSIEARKNMSEARKALFASGYVSYNKGQKGIVKASVETKKKMSFKSKGRKQTLEDRLKKSEAKQKLTNQQIEEIKNDPRSCRIIAKELGIGKSTILRIKRNEGLYLSQIFI